MSDRLNFVNAEEINVTDQISRYFSFWPLFLVSAIIFLVSANIYLRYTTYLYTSKAKIEIFDKSQDSEMALPTSMTIFNRSMINLSNEIGVLNSFSLHQRVASKLNSNIKFYSVGTVKTLENHHSEWFKDYEIQYKIAPHQIKSNKRFDFIIDKGKMEIIEYNNSDETIKKYKFDNFSTLKSNHNLPFEITINSVDLSSDLNKSIKFFPYESTVEDFRSLITIAESDSDSDQLDISLSYPNIKIGEEYVNTLINEFDKDGIVDRQSEYKRTMVFVDSRSVFLLNELEQIELKKQRFKESKNLSNIQTDASINVTQKYTYDSELFDAKSQRDLILLLEETLVNNEFDLMPLNIGVKDLNISNSILEYNKTIKERDRYLITAGPNNLFIKNLENQILDNSKNIFISIDNYKRSLDNSIANLELKEKEFSSIYKNMPENEKILRSIERELEVKESLFLLLLQKREEAAINYAVIKPSIKIIDGARSSSFPASPKKTLTYLTAFTISLFLPFFIIYLWFLFDTKIHTREQLVAAIPDLPLIGEIPYIRDKNTLNQISSAQSRDVLSESIRMIIANLNFVLFNGIKNNQNNVILVTSSIKGEGKTIVSVNTASILSSKFNKVLLIGADLRNPQIHKFINVKKSVKGLSDYIYREENDWKNFLIKKDKLDILLSGTIPPNPTELLSSKKFQLFMEEVKDLYDYIIIDSAPCLLVSDTFEISKYVATTLYVVRANFSDNKLCSFIKESHKEGKLSNMNLVLNSVGNSTLYGYKYGYQYGYKYSYKYGYNYGYGYGYNEED